MWPSRFTWQVLNVTTLYFVTKFMHSQITYFATSEYLRNYNDSFLLFIYLFFVAGSKRQSGKIYFTDNSWMQAKENCFYSIICTSKIQGRGDLRNPVSFLFAFLTLSNFKMLCVLENPSDYFPVVSVFSAPSLNIFYFLKCSFSCILLHVFAV